MLIKEMERALFEYLEKVTPEELEEELLLAGAEEWPDEVFLTVSETTVSSKNGHYTFRKYYASTSVYNKFETTGEVA